MQLAGGRAYAPRVAARTSDALLRTIDLCMRWQVRPQLVRSPLGGGACLLAAATLLASSGAPLPAGAPDVPKHAEHWLAGSWHARFALDSAWHVVEPVRARQLTGTIRFDPVPPVPAGAPARRAVHAGTFALDFTLFGFRPESAEALGWYDSPEAVRIVLNPVVDHGVIELVGKHAGDSVAGEWTMTGYPSGARGQFVVRPAE
ncbi:MAG: hypothetical protein ACREOC_06465 [Gemmatimonadales bacterium]